MTTSVSNGVISALAPAQVPSPTLQPKAVRGVYRIRHTLASRFAFLVLCVAIVLSALAYGTVHYWALEFFNLGALTIIVLWVTDGWQLGNLRISRNSLQLPLLAFILLGVVQLLPLRTSLTDGRAPLSLDPYSTRLVLIQFSSLFVYFAATLVFIDTPHRLRILVRTIVIFGFCLAVFGLTQSFTSPTKVYWLRDLSQSTAFGPFINRHHFAGYMEMTIAIPLGLLFSGVIEREKQILYLFAAGLMGVALVMTGSRGGIVSLVAEILFFVIVTGIVRRPGSRRKQRTRVRSVAIRTGMAVALIVALVVSVMLLGGEMSLNRLVDSVNTDDPTTGRAHFWSVTLAIIKAHPLLGTGLGAFGVIYTGFDSRNGLFRLEQAHNDYLQVLSDAGIVGAILALIFVVLLFGKAMKKFKSGDDFRRGLTIAAAGGCFAVLVHSFFDFTLHTTSNALLFLVLAGLATMDNRVEHLTRKRRHRSRRKSTTPQVDLNPESADVV
jgi:O-antigen ligase